MWEVLRAWAESTRQAANAGGGPKFFLQWDWVGEFESGCQGLEAEPGSPHTSMPFLQAGSLPRMLSLLSNALVLWRHSKSPLPGEIPVF